ncbi:MAG: hypothetical protein ACFFDI_01095 [Promethearchaeota archaeon]
MAEFLYLVCFSLYLLSNLHRYNIIVILHKIKKEYRMTISAKGRKPTRPSKPPRRAPARKEYKPPKPPPKPPKRQKGN